MLEIKNGCSIHRLKNEYFPKYTFIFVYIGFNLLLPLVFDFIPKLSCGKVFILALAVDFISMPIRIELEMFISHKFREVEQ